MTPFYVALACNTIYLVVIDPLVTADVILLTAPWDPRSATHYVKVL